MSKARLRIIAGTAKGRLFKGPRGDEVTRPTADRVRQTWFDLLGQWLDGLRVLELYAGTGALSFEALSRGAASAVLVESNREAAALCRENAASLGFAERVEVLSLPVERALERLRKEGRSFELILADPPYAAEAVASLLEGAQSETLLPPGGWLCIEHGKGEDAPERAGRLERVDQRRFGDTVLSFYRAESVRAP